MGKGPHSPKTRGRRTKEPGQRSLKLERRAMRALEIWADRPSMRSDEVKAQIRAEFKCGYGASDEALTRAYELFELYRDDQGLALTNRVAMAYWEIFEEAKRDRDHQGARKALDSLRSHLGLGAPDRLEITGTMGRSEDPDLEDFTQEQLELLAKLDQAERQRQGKLPS